MVERGGFYTDGTNVIFQTVSIEWNLGFDIHAKHAYINRIIDALGDKYKPCYDVTSASPDPMARSLSPLFLHYNGTSLETLIMNNKELMVPGVADFFYANALSVKQKEFIRNVNCFIDVFYKPENKRNTQACHLAVFKLLQYQNKEYLLGNMDNFLSWYNDVGFYWLGGQR